MKILNVVFLFFIKFANIQIFTLIANFVESTSIYEQIPSFNVPIPNSYVVFDLLDENLDHYYPLGLSVKSGPNSKKEFFVDNLVTFGKEVKIVFGNRCVSLTSFARNIKATLTWDLLWYKVSLEYDLHGSKITRNYAEEGVTLPGQQRKFVTVPEMVVPDSLEDVPENLEDESLSEDDMEESSLADGEQPSSQPGKRKKATEVSDEEFDEYDTTPMTESEGTLDSQLTETLSGVTTEESLPTLPPLEVNSRGEIEITQDNLHGATGYKDADTVVAGSVDFRCVHFDNTGDVYKKLLLKGTKLSLPKTAEQFEVCYRNHQGDYYVLVSSLFSNVVVEQTYKSGTFGMSPLKDFSHFEGLKTLFDRRMKTARSVSTQAPSPLNLDQYQPDDKSFLEKINCGKCTVFRYIDGLETEDRVGSVTSVLFGDYEFFVRPGKRFVMASVCNPYLSTRYVSVMVKEAFVYENRIFYSADGKVYHERRHLEDEERLNIINMTSRVWHKRNTNGKIGDLEESGPDEVEVLCLNQLTGTKTSTSKSCKDVDKLNNFTVQFTSKDMTHLYYKKNKPKSSVLLGNLMFDLNPVTDGDKYLYVSHPEGEPISVLVVEKHDEAYAIVETVKGSNYFMAVNEALEDSPTRFSRKDVNVAIYRGSLYGITWDYNDVLKTHYLFPSNFPDYCLGDLTFHNMKVISYRGEGYKQVSTKDKDKLVKIRVTAVMSKKKVVLDVEVDGKNTSVEWANPPSESQSQDQNQE